jgi:hypothetical protein
VGVNWRGCGASLEHVDDLTTVSTGLLQVLFPDTLAVVFPPDPANEFPTSKE